MEIATALERIIISDKPNKVQYALGQWQKYIESKERQDTTQHYKAMERSRYREMLVIRHIHTSITCPHHLLPVGCYVDIAYRPGGYVLGLSKFKRICDSLATICTQEEYSEILADDIFANIPHISWVGVKITAKHDCMHMRGVEDVASETITKAFRTKMIIKDHVEEISRFEALTNTD